MTRFCVATNFDPELPSRVAAYGAVELFGKLRSDAMGGGRASYMLSSTSKGMLERHVDICHSNGLQFNYLLNAACFDNVEFTRDGQKRIIRLLDWISDIGVDWVTVSVPYLLELVKARYPRLKVKVGAFANVDTPEKAKFFAETGADCITVHPLGVNRDFDRLRAIRLAVDCDLQLIANITCLYECPMTPYHNVGLSHASQIGSKGLYLEYCVLRCLTRRLREPVNYIKSPWIRPDDLSLYTDIGYTNFKILERDAPTEALVNRTRAYHDEFYDGNLLDIVQLYGFKEKRSRTQPSRKLLWDIRTFFRPSKVNPGRLLPFRDLARLHGMIYERGEENSFIHIDNRSLDGFVDKFVEKTCTNIDCNQCQHCHRYAEKALYVDEEYARKSLAIADKLLADMAEGRMWWSGKRSNRGER